LSGHAPVGKDKVVSGGSLGQKETRGGWEAGEERGRGGVKGVLKE